MTEPFVAAAHLDRLKDFQRSTVAHVVNRFYDDANPTRRFLVADETGLGKSVVARGVIAEAVERLLKVDRVKRIDIVYVCSNADIAAQNLSRLNVVGNNRVEFRTRLTMLAAQSHDLNSSSERFGKAVNLIAFTPATSFEKGWRTGKAEERALLFVLLQRILGLTGYRRTAALRALQGGVTKLDRFRGMVDWYEYDELDQTIAKAFTSALRKTHLAKQFERLIDEIGRKHSLPADLKETARHLTGEMRTVLAQASIHALEPDLIILDEFQRFRHLLNIETGGEAAELARHLFEWDQARTLLLSATPYKPFTLAEEDEAGEDHYGDFLTTLGFLSSNDNEWISHVKSALASYRSRLLAGQPCEDVVAELRSHLLQYMCRTERPVVEAAHKEVSDSAQQVTADDLVDYVGLRDLARAVDGQVQVEYWKSAPYFINFLDGYQVGERLKKSLRGGTTSAEVSHALGRVTQLNRGAMERFESIDMGNARLRALADRTLGDGWWQLLWIPPSLPYFESQGVYAEPFAKRITKQLVFSSWSATPTAIAGLLSYEAERRLASASSRLIANTAEARRRLATRLDYRLKDGKPGGMSALALFWPHPTLAELTDPLRMARAFPSRTLSATEAEDWALGRLAEAAGTPLGAEEALNPASDMFSWPGSLPISLRRSDPEELSSVMVGRTPTDPMEDADDGRQPARLDVHVREALRHASSHRPSRELATLAMHSPGNIAYRAISRLVSAQDSATPAALWGSAAALANGLRSLFNRPESTMLLDQLYPDVPYWQAVLAYCRDGNLQAVLDEFLHHQRSSTGDESLDDVALADLVIRAEATISMRGSRYLAFDPADPEGGIPLGSRFALRYGSARGKTEDLRLPEVRAAFNSPFWPFVLTSTSVGQEGIDFHWWCHSVVHWNTPASPVDFEQREGRVNRFGGHAVRRNLALAHRADVMMSNTVDPWAAAYDAARSVHPELGDFCPYWVFPGPYAVERHLLPFPLSKDGPRAQSLKRDLVHYRLALGQPRQEDLLAALAARDPDVSAITPLDLRPPAL